jgi:hypothetical protein
MAGKKIGKIRENGFLPSAAKPQPNRHRILQEATEATEGITFPLITSLRQGFLLR